MASQNPVSALTEPSGIGQVTINRDSLSSTDTLQASESDVDATSKTVVAQTVSLDNTATNDPESAEAPVVPPQGGADEDDNGNIPRTVREPQSKPLYTIKDYP